MGSQSLFNSSVSSSCSVKLCTLVEKINLAIVNQQNASIILDFHKYMQEKGSSENHQVNNLKVVIDFAKFLGPTMLYEVENREQVISFLNRKIKSLEHDPEKRWITTWNHYLNRIKLFERWLFNHYLRHKKNLQENEEWITPDFCKIRPKRTNRLSPYSESEICERDELLTLIKYEPHLRNKAILSLMWDLNARPHELTLLRIKNIRLKEAYGEGEIPHQAKTGSGPILLMMSFCYVRDWINQHPFKNEPTARLICNLHNGAPIKAKSVWNMMRQLRNRITRLIETQEVSDESERQKLVYLLTTKKWNPYSFRHSSITADSDYLPEYALKKKVRWVMNSRQGNRYIKTRMGNDLKQKILTYNGIAPPDELKKKPSVLECPRCELINAIDNKYCSKCSYPLVRPRIVRIGTHRKTNFSSRISEHFLINESKMNFNQNRAKPSDRSVFRKNLGRCILKKDKINYLNFWNIDFTTKANRIEKGPQRIIELEKKVEEQITRLLRSKFSFSFIAFEEDARRIGSKVMESKLIGTVARCRLCKASPNWLGKFSPIAEIRNGKLWLSQHLMSIGMNQEDKRLLNVSITKEQLWTS